MDEDWDILPLSKDESILDLFDVEYPEEDDIDEIMEEYGV